VVPLSHALAVVPPPAAATATLRHGFDVVYVFGVARVLNIACFNSMHGYGQSLTDIN